MKPLLHRATHKGFEFWILIILLALYLLSCKSQKSITGEKSKTDRVTSLDSAHVVKTDRSLNDSSRWRRETVYFPQYYPRDTTVIRPEYRYMNTVQPIAIVRESGENWHNAREVNVDSLSKAIRDSLRAEESRKEVEKNTMFSPLSLLPSRWGRLSLSRQSWE